MPTYRASTPNVKALLKLYRTPAKASQANWVLPSDELLSMKAIPTPAPMKGVMTDVGKKSYERLTNAVSWPALLVRAVPGTFRLIGVCP